jgi:CheY-like chemotaxis protein
MNFNVLNNSWNILIVDDDSNLHIITKNAFLDEEFYQRPLNFLSAYSEQDALEILNEFHEQIAVIILDMAMGDNGSEGYNLINYINCNLKNENMQIILRTGYYNSQQVNEIKTAFPKILILEKGDTSVELLIEIVSERINVYKLLTNLQL